MDTKINDIFLSLFVEKNSDGTRNLRLKGKELQQRIGQRLTSNEMYRVTTFMEFSEKITYLNLSYNYIGDDGLEVLSNNFFILPTNTLKHLNIMKCSITRIGLESMLDKALVLETLRLNCNKLGYSSIRVVAQLIDECPTLVHLDMGDTDQSLESTELLLVKTAKMEVLDVSRLIPLGDNYQYDTPKLADAFSYFLEGANNLVELHIQKNQLDGHDVEVLLEGLRLNKSLKMLDLGYNQIGDYGLEVLSEWLKTRPILIGLNVAGNKIKNIGASALSFGMPLSKLRLLNISFNEITEEGIINLLHSIKKCYMMRIFLIWGNKFGHKANKIIQRMLRSTVFEQVLIDVKIYCVDDVLYAAHYPADTYKHKYYDVMDYGCATELKIKRNKTEGEKAKPRPLIKLKHIARYPPVTEYE